MKDATKPKRRCAVYTRKSSEEGLEQEFNSLHAQREACEAYIASQRSEGWVLVRDQYDDGGVSGSTLERPGLKRLVADIEDGLVDVVVVYKIDRLSRSLADFAKLVEVFDRDGVTFVSVTQSFNTTTSMGRLTLNILLSFAQFEREVTAERIRDKFAASRAKGMWMGGWAPLGYDVRDRKLVVNPAEAKTVRMIFERFVEMGSATVLALEGDDATAVLFAETSSFFGAASPNLPHLLWALELQAWDPTYFRRVALLLAKLASKDPGGRGGNRPISSLRSIFIAWSPGTNAPLAERLAVIDEIVGLHPQVGWRLVTMLLPKQHDTTSVTQRPRYRDAGASDREALTHEIVGKTYNAVIDRALSMVGDDPAHWIELAESFPQFSTDRRAQFLDMLAPYAQQSAGQERVELRDALRRLAKRHARFRRADWVLPDDELECLQGIVRSLESTDPFEQARALFDEWDPYFTGDFAAAERALDQRRANAVANLAATSGATDVIKLAGSVRFGRTVAHAAAAGIVDEAILKAILTDGAPDAPAPEISIALAGRLRHSRGETYDAELLALAQQSAWGNARTASMLLDWPEERQTWNLVANLGADAERYFWSNRRPYRFEGSADDMEELVHHFVAAGQAGNALSVVHPREKQLSWATTVAILGARVGEINEAGADGQLDRYLVEELFKAMRCREGVDQWELARWEYVYFPFLEHKDTDLALYELMANDPKFYVSIIKDVFVADDVEIGDVESTQEQRNRASVSYRILINNKRVPGETDGTINQELLDAWIAGMLEEGRTQKRTKIVPSYIGRTLAHAAEADGIWPPPTVAAAIERLRSDEVERSIIIERYNMRGVHRKSLFEGGGQERELATQYRGWAAAHVVFPRTKAMLMAAAQGWDKDARRADEEAERDRIRFE